MNRPLRIILLTVLAVALLAAGTVGGILYTHKDGGGTKRFSALVSDDTCPSVLKAVPASLLDRVVPASRHAVLQQWVYREKHRLTTKCAVTADGKQVLKVSVEQRNHVHEPRRAGTGPGHGKTKSIPGFRHSWSSQDAAGLSVPCTKDSGKGSDDATNLYVSAQAWREPYGKLREDMVRIVERAARTNKGPACEAPPAVG
ncbi:hypothetical protein GCM10009801_42890 [Streptomyces albiaxialis]|uniref:DUF3558 domain-containing protein n=1 Tax=Streptomyces albiaxialis TaxID=329523 RepID=A0ABN2W422_9ACTN